MGTTDLNIKDNKAMEKSAPSIYSCSKCGQEVEMKEGVLIRRCGHENEIVIVSISAVCKGQGRT